MEKYNVRGMSCEVCRAKVEKSVSEVPGVLDCSVNLLTNSMKVKGSATSKEIIEAVRHAGYDASLPGDDDNREDLGENETIHLKKRLVFSLIFLIILMYFSMGHNMLNLPIPKFFEGNYIGLGIIQMILSTIVMLINKDFFTSGFKGLLHAAPNMDTLVAIGSMTSFVWSTILLFEMTGKPDALNSSGGFYYESAAMIVTLITVGKLLESISKGRTTDALKGLMSLIPDKARVEREGKEIEIPAEEVRIGDIFILKPGDKVPVDGIVTYGVTSVDESALTGESIPNDKREGDRISAGTTNISGFVKARADKVGVDTTLSQIIQMVSDASESRAKSAKIADKVSGVFVPSVMIISIIVTVLWLALGQTVSYALARGITILVISCPCALGLATPVAIMVGSGVGARNGILFKTAEVLEETGKIKRIAIDKTGTITIGIPSVTDVIPLSGTFKEELLRYALSIEERSEHPLAKSIVDYCNTSGIERLKTKDFKALPGNGVIADIEDPMNGSKKDRIIAGNRRLIEGEMSLSKEIMDISDRLAEEGKTPVFFSKNNDIIGIISLADKVKDDSQAAIMELNELGIETYMLTGDNQKTAKAIGNIVGIKNVISEVLPGEKENVIRKLSDGGKVAMVGDGINDAPALTSADVGIAIGAGSDIAIDSADIVLVNNSLLDVAAAVRLSRATLRNIKENLFWAFFYNILMIPLAAGLYANLLGWTMNPMWGAAAMSLSSFCVCMNALRLNYCKIYKDDKDDKEQVVMEEKMTKTVNIEGMMCEHCEATVKKALLGIDGVVNAEVSHKNGTAKIELSKDVDNKIIKDTVEEKDYKFISVE